MAFEQFKLDLATFQTRSIFNNYVYETEDTVAETQAAGYFDASRFAGQTPDIWVGSFIFCNCSNGTWQGIINADGTTTPVGYDGDLANLTDGQVPKYDEATNSLIYGGATVDPDTGEWTFDESITVPGGSINVGLNITLSDFGESVAIFNDSTDEDKLAVAQLVDTTVGIIDPDIGKSPPAQDLSVSVGDSEISTAYTTTEPLEFPVDPNLFIESAPSDEFIIVSNRFEFETIPPSGKILAEVWIGTDDTGEKIFEEEFDVNVGTVIFAPRSPQTFRKGVTYFARDTPVDGGSFKLRGETIMGTFIPAGELNGYSIRRIDGTTEETVKDQLGENQYININSSYTSDTAVTGGAVVTYDPTATTDTVTDGDFTTAEAGVSNAMVVTDGSGTFAQDDIIQLEGFRVNNGYYEVEDHTGNDLTIRGIGLVDTVEDFTKRDFVFDQDTGTITKVNISVLRSGTGGSWEIGAGSETGIAFDDVVVGPGGSDTEIQFNDNGVLAGDSDLTWDKSGNILTVDGTARILGDAHISGDATVDGTLTAVNTDNLNIKDANIYINNGYANTTATTSGIVANYQGTATADSVSSGAFTAGIPATSNPTVITVGSGTFSTSDLIQISGTTDSENDGLFEVLGHSGTTLTIRGVGATPTVEDFTQDQFVASTDSATITKINISVMRSGDSGVWESGNGSSTPIIFNDVALGDLTNKSVPFSDASGNLTEDNANFSYDDVSNTLAISVINSASIVNTGTVASINFNILDGVGGAITLESAANVTNYSLVFPDAIGVEDDILKLDASGNLQFVIDESIYTTDGSIDGVTRIADAINAGEYNIRSFDTDSSSFNDSTDIFIANKSISIGYSEGDGLGAKTAFSTIKVSSTDMTVTDTLNSKGLVYAANYGANFTAQSLVDKQYSDEHVNSYTVSNTPSTDQFLTFNGTNTTWVDINWKEAYGSMYEDNSGGTTIANTGTYKGWVSATAGEVDNNGIITFTNNGTADRLTVGTGGAGDYLISFNLTFTNDGGKVTTAAIHVNNSEQGEIKGAQQGDSSSQASIAGSGILSLSDNDFVDLRIESEDNDDQDVYFVNVSIRRLAKA